MSINKLLSQDLFNVYKNVSEQVIEIKKSGKDIENKKKLMSKLLNNFQDQLKNFNNTIVDFSNSFIKKYNLNDHVISARIGSPTPYGHQPKSYLWSGISIDKEKSYSFQYSWVFQPSKLELTFCFGSGESPSGRVEKEKKAERENNLRELERKLFLILSDPNNRAILENLIVNEEFVITSEWLALDGDGNQDIEKYIDNLKGNNGAKSGITRYFQKDELLAEGFDLEERIYHYFEIFKPLWDQLHEDISNTIYQKNNSKKEVIKEENGEFQNKPSLELKSYSYEDIIFHINKYIASKGFFYENEEIINLFLSLKTKPFVIISGISGTGKTKVVQWFAESIGASEANGQFTIIPVRPDWNDGSDLLGYVDIKGEFRDGPLTKILRRAEENPTLPYFVLLDEMNLARVEYYFSDILSVMESRRWENGKIITSPLLFENGVNKSLTLPSNVFVIGTVNMDETTHQFSKKVLDRANTIEFNEVNLGYLEFLKDIAECEKIELKNEMLAGRYLHLKDVYQVFPNIIGKATAELVKINEILKPIGAHIGYRVRDEICFYLSYNAEGSLFKFDQAFDRCILQKILPRISGSDYRVQNVLEKLLLYCTNKIFIEEIETMDDFSTTKYPKSAKKLVEMRRRLDDGFTSFWISS